MKRTKLRVEKLIQKYTLRKLKQTLPERHKMFCHEYIRNGWNGTQAYYKVYPTVSNDNSAAVCATNLLRSIKIRQYIDYIKEDYETLCGVSKAKQLREYSKIAYSSVKDIRKGWIELEEWETILENNPDALDAVETIETKTEQVMDRFKQPIEICYVKVKLHNKVAALEKIDNLMGYKSAEKVNVNTTQMIDITQYTDEEKQTLLQLARKSQYVQRD